MLRKMLCLLFASGLLLASCSTTKQYLPAADLALGAAQIAAAPGIQSAIENKSMTKCVGWVSMREAAANLRAYVDKVMETGEWLSELPALTVHYGDCEALKLPDGMWRPVLPEVAKPVLDGVVLPLVAMLKPHLLSWVEGADIDCRTKIWLVAALDYFLGAAGPVLLELAEPDGELSIPAVPLDFSPCSG